MAVGEVILVQTRARQVECPRCRYRWFYRGKSDHFICCSKCRTTITINPRDRSGGILSNMEVERKSNIEPIYVTRCLSEDCIGSYVDTFSGSLLIICRDPKHNNQKHYAGPVTKPRPALDDASFTQTKVNSHGKEAHT